MKKHTVVIAEIGECFNGDLRQAEKLIRVAAAAGCDYAKFQTLDKEGISQDDPERDWFLSIALEENELRVLIKYCRDHKIKFLCSPEKTENAGTLKKLGCREVKIASTCAWDTELIDYVAAQFPIVFISTGMASLEEIDDLMDKFDRQEQVYLMHCISEYPTGPLLEQRGLKALNPKDVRLRMMDILMRRYPQAIVGYSDHTVGLTAPIAAVARGAGVIEKHITLDRETPVKNFIESKQYLGTDHVLSVEPDELEAMVHGIREVESMLEPDTWDRTEGEKILMSFLKGRFSF
jgi:N,N'-diacetyllegionaminate synthase